MCNLMAISNENVLLGGEGRLFKKILIANRGEISVRVINTCKKLNIPTVAIYSEVDRLSRAVSLADEAVCVGPAQSALSYLNTDRIMQAIRQTGADAVHPGYGFLSENKDFCTLLEQHDVQFIGPGHHAIEAMGDKIQSKKIAQEAKVNTIPGFLGEINSEEEAVKIAHEIGYPVMIKASAGGGGKGMRIANSDEEVKMGFRLSKDEAKASFGDDRMFVEKFIENPRHIEIQILADTHGNVVAFPERECSIQRRNQKVIEEAPSVILSEETRREMARQAKALCRAVGYVSAGTLEYLYDSVSKNFYFLEMNTRLQVEHPITELITGVDLVEQMVRIAAGHPLPQELIEHEHTLPIQGWAFESRVYAEDPLRNFLPSTGRLLKYLEPETQSDDLAAGSIVRVDSGVSEGSDISMFYDPMISKLVTHGETREYALKTMKQALNRYVIRGLPGNNIGFLQDVYRHPRFIDGEKITTKFIEEEYPEGFQGVSLTKNEKKQLQSASAIIQNASDHSLNHHKGKTTKQINLQLKNNKQVKVQMQNGSGNMIRLRVPNDQSSAKQLKEIGSAFFQQEKLINWPEKCQYVSTDGSFGDSIPLVVIEILQESSFEAEKNSVFAVGFLNKKNSKVENVMLLEKVCWNSTLGLFEAEENGELLALQLMGMQPEGFKMQHQGALHDIVIRSPKEQELAQHMLKKPEVDYSRYLQCPMPGVLVSVAVEEGEMVEIGQEIAVVEAMKMQNVLRAEKKAKIKSIYHKQGDSLKVDEIIVEYE